MNNILSLIFIFIKEFHKFICLVNKLIMKTIYIFTDDEQLEESGANYIDDYLNENFPGYTFIISENNRYVLTDEENESFFVME